MTESNYNKIAFNHMYSFRNIHLCLMMAVIYTRVPFAQKNCDLCIQTVVCSRTLAFFHTCKSYQSLLKNMLVSILLTSLEPFKYLLCETGNTWRCFPERKMVKPIGKAPWLFPKALLFYVLRLFLQKTQKLRT